MKSLTFTPEPIIAEQLQELARITQRPIGDLINDILDSPLDQMLGEQQDTDYMQLVIAGVVYSDRAQAEAVAENYNALERAIVHAPGGHFYVHTARSTDAGTVEFSESELLEA
jgi:hypothetical protein